MSPRQISVGRHDADTGRLRQSHRGGCKYNDSISSYLIILRFLLRKRCLIFAATRPLSPIGKNVIRRGQAPEQEAQGIGRSHPKPSTTHPAGIWSAASARKNAGLSAPRSVSESRNIFKKCGTVRATAMWEREAYAITMPRLNRLLARRGGSLFHLRFH